MKNIKNNIYKEDKIIKLLPSNKIFANDLAFSIVKFIELVEPIRSKKILGINNNFYYSPS
jgi:hypothetical protein